MWEALWRRSVTLAREYPVLWLPVICAELAGFALRTYKVAFITSVGAPNFHDGHIAALSAATLISIVITSAPVVLYGTAFFITADAAWERSAAPLSGARVPVGRRILALSMRGLLVGWPLGIATSLVTLTLLGSRWHLTGLPRTIFADLMGAMMMSFFAYLMVPPALRLLANLDPMLDQRSVRMGQKCAIAAVIASSGLIILEHIVIGIIQGTRSEVLAARAVGSVVAALPYAPLYVALGLLARDHPVEATAQDNVLTPGGIGSLL